MTCRYPMGGVHGCGNNANGKECVCVSYQSPCRRFSRSFDEFCAVCSFIEEAHDGWDSEGTPVREVPRRSYPSNEGLVISYNMLTVPKCTCGYQVGHVWADITSKAAGDKVDDEVSISATCKRCKVLVTLVMPGKL